MIHLITYGFDRMCELLVDPAYVLKKDELDIHAELGIGVHTFKKNDKGAFASMGVREWFLADMAFTIPVHEFKVKTVLTLGGVVIAVHSMFNIWKNKYNTMKVNMDEFHCWYPLLTIEKNWFTYTITMRTTTFSGRYID